MAITVNGELVAEERIYQEVDRLRPHYDEHVRHENPDGGDQQLYEWAKENVVEQTLLRQAAEADAEAIDPATIEEAFEQIKENLEGMEEADAKREIELQMKIEQLVNGLTNSADAPDDATVDAFYKDNAEWFMQPEQVRASHIVKHVDGTHTKDDAHTAILEVQKRLADGEMFETIAAESSDCPENAGDLGFFPRGQMVQEFEDVIFPMEVGDISEPFLTQFGYHIAKVTDKTENTMVPLEEVREELTEYLTEQGKQGVVEKYIDGLKTAATVEDVDDEE
ncbi:MAG: hypothetical protein HN909_03665 [Phycisphaerales bacterium]|jgi:parvulin-like peptidyl-prolyl isomerase|nr:hypothetical protein [Phycisphaerales bacterium]MBT7170849.1 hypothetical protein [Phycisphaerales bacterium]